MAALAATPPLSATRFTGSPSTEKTRVTGSQSMEKTRLTGSQSIETPVPEATTVTTLIEYITSNTMSFIGVALGGFAGDGAIIASLFDTLECEIGRPLVLTFLLHPTGYRWSSGLSEYAGAIIGNWGISITCVVIYDVVARGASAITKRRLREKLKSPSFAFFVEGYFRSVVFAAGFVLLFNAEQPSLRVMGAATILLYATIAGALAILLGRRAKYNHAVRSASAVSLWGYVDG